MEKMGNDERWGYLTGLVDMMSYQALLRGDKASVRCIMDCICGRCDVFASLVK